MTVRAAVIPAPGAPVEVRTFPEPALEPGAALLRTLYSEVCGTDVHLQHGRLAGVPYPLIPGHINVGTLERLQSPVCDAFGAPLAEGDLVTFLDVHETCHNCWYCLVAKASTRCPQRKVYGITYGATEGLLGGWSELVWLKPGVKIMRLPEAAWGAAQRLGRAMQFIYFIRDVAEDAGMGRRYLPLEREGRRWPWLKSAT